MRRDRAGGFVYFFEQQRERRTNETDQDAEAETVNIAEQRALLLKDDVENRERFFRCRPVTGGVRQRALNMRELLLKVEIELRHVPGQSCLARLGVTRDQCGDRSDANAPTDIAH